MDEGILKQEITFKAVRSGGAGGQHVNKVATKVVLTFDLAKSKAFEGVEKERLFLKLSKRLSREHTLQLQSDTARSQYRNKELVLERFLDLIRDALKEKKKRRKTRLPKSAIEKRLEAKKRVAYKKSKRKPPPTDL